MTNKEFKQLMIIFIIISLCIAGMVKASSSNYRCQLSKDIEQAIYRIGANL